MSWLSGTDIAIEGEWVWDNTGDPLIFDNWVNQTISMVISIVCHGGFWGTGTDGSMTRAILTDRQFVSFNPE